MCGDSSSTRTSRTILQNGEPCRANSKREIVCLNKMLVSEDGREENKIQTSYAQNTSGLGGSFAGVYMLPCIG